MNYFILTQEFIENSKKSKNLKELAVLFHKLIKKMGCTHFVCMSHVDALNPPDDAIVLTNYPLEWAIYHSDQNYHKFDPIHQTCKTKLTPFTWSNDRWRYCIPSDQVGLIKGIA